MIISGGASNKGTDPGSLGLPQPVIFDIENATKYRKRQHLLLKQSTVLHYGNADAMTNVSCCILKKVQNSNLIQLCSKIHFRQGKSV